MLAFESLGVGLQQAQQGLEQGARGHCHVFLAVVALEDQINGRVAFLCALFDQDHAFQRQALGWCAVDVTTGNGVFGRFANNELKGVHGVISVDWVAVNLNATQIRYYVVQRRYEKPMAITIAGRVARSSLLITFPILNP